MYMYMFYLFHMFSIMVYHRMLNTICAIQQDLVACPSCYTGLHLLITSSQSFPPLPPLLRGFEMPSFLELGVWD